MVVPVSLRVVMAVFMMVVVVAAISLMLMWAGMFMVIVIPAARTSSNEYGRSQD